MTPQGRSVVLRVIAILGFTSAAFALLEAPARDIEAGAAVAVLRAAGSENVWQAGPDTIQVVPSGHGPFRAVVTPACSALASMLAIGALATVVPRAGRARRGAAVAAAMGAVAAGNIVRIAASIAVGLAAGRSSLVLFHDWAGSAFAFAYVLGGYVLFLYLLLPGAPARRPALAVHGG